MNAAGKPVSDKILLSIPGSEYLAIRPPLEFSSLATPMHLHPSRTRVNKCSLPQLRQFSEVGFACSPKYEFGVSCGRRGDGRTAEAGLSQYSS